ncbi:glutamine amidotransferase family protein [Ancylobacter sonchi]|uniref:class II glutamine amidotransferase n=1 Tax=Ancylobacter sonchi TaxID=1937790 RepID=UPI001BD50587|nr:glutamine amidotransferase family protein [Ancylobacter sonchi]MBS7536982.1 glutamine amidotransferase family protein [Ancylobacter sonchi]
MCGIVGLFIKDPKLEPQLGALLAEMLDVMCSRGPDSAGFAVYGSGKDGTVKLTLRGPAGTDFAAIGAALGHEVTPRDTHAVLTVPAAAEADVRTALKSRFPAIDVISTGARMELYKEVGLPADVAKRFKLETMSGTHAIGHTRMATESAVTTDGAHPFSTGSDQCLVHNGSLSNHAGLRRRLEREGLHLATENDSEVAAAYLTYRMREGDTLGEALEHSLGDLDGFYTFVVGTESGFGVLRDPIACKPAVMAETDQYVAFGSEYRALAGLPGIENARVFEPEPAKVYFWDRAA